MQILKGLFFLVFIVAFLCGAASYANDGDVANTIFCWFCAWLFIKINE